MAVTEQGLLEREKDSMTLNMGPSHPSTHGVFRVVLEMDGNWWTRRNLISGFCIQVLKKLQRQSVTYTLSL